MKIFGLELTSRSVAFLLIFSLIGLLLYQVNYSAIIGVKFDAKFTLFQFIGPMAAGILGPAMGVLSVLIVSLSNFLLTGKALELPVIVSFFTMAAAAIYFGSKNKATALVAAVCMLLFWLNPIGQEAWIYALYWLIPIGATFYKQNIIARSLGATFTAHAIGSVVYLYAFSIPAASWFSLLPVVAIERLSFAAGIAVSYYVANTVLQALSTKVDLSFINIEKKYALVKA
ncbi:hypothetical protein H0O00_01150 [Candidatus Micrarchaeota archaeon]|nr:hypothetical protein [Candidatus Micrarchaeota archaeon]